MTAITVTITSPFCHAIRAWAAQPGCVCGGGDNVRVPPLLGPAGYRGVQRSGPIKMIFASTADSLYYK